MKNDMENFYQENWNLEFDDDSREISLGKNLDYQDITPRVLKNKRNFLYKILLTVFTKSEKMRILATQNLYKEHESIKQFRKDNGLLNSRINKSWIYMDLDANYLRQTFEVNITTSLLKKFASSIVTVDFPNEISGVKKIRLSFLSLESENKQTIVELWDDRFIRIRTFDEEVIEKMHKYF